MTNTPDFWHQIRSLFEESLTLPPEERQAFVVNRTEGALGVRDEVLALLDADAAERLSDSNVPDLSINGTDYAADMSATLVHPLARMDLGTATSRLGHEVDGYRLLSVLGSGASGTVYRAARSSDPEVHVALKLFHFPLGAHEDTRRPLTERQALLQVDHPHVVRLMQSGVDNDHHPYLVMELIDGQPLDERLERNGRLDVSQVSLEQRIEWFRSICEAIAAAHEKLILHRDLKPKNVLVDRFDRVHVTDFGLAKFLGQTPSHDLTMTQSGQLIGTPPYMSPEQIEGSRDETVATDIYGLGGLLYFLLTGEPPFDRPTWLETYRAVLQEVAPSPRTFDKRIPKDLETICLKCLAKAPGQRYQSVAALVQDLQAFVEGRPISARPVSQVTRLAYAIRRHPATSALAAVSLLLLLTCMLVLTVSWRQAVENRQLAERSRAELLEMIGGLTTSLEQMSDDPATLPWQRELLQQITHGYDQLDESQLDEETLNAVALAWYRLGEVELHMKLRPEERDRANHKAAALYAELARRFPSNNDYLFSSFHCRLRTREIEQAEELIRELLRRQPDDERFQDAFTYVLCEQTYPCIKSKQWDTARRQLEEAATISAKLLKKHPRKANYRKRMGEIAYLRFKVEMHCENELIAWAAFADAVRYMQQTEALDPLNLVANSQGVLHLVTGSVIHHYLGNPEAAQELSDAAIELSRRAMERFPAHRQVRWRRYQALLTAALLARDQKRIDDFEHHRSQLAALLAEQPVSEARTSRFAMPRVLFGLSPLLARGWSENPVALSQDQAHTWTQDDVSMMGWLDFIEGRFQEVKLAFGLESSVDLDLSITTCLTFTQHLTPPGVPGSDLGRHAYALEKLSRGVPASTIARLVHPSRRRCMALVLQREYFYRYFEEMSYDEVLGVAIMNYRQTSAAPPTGLKQHADGTADDGSSAN